MTVVPTHAEHGSHLTLRRWGRAGLAALAAAACAPATPVPAQPAQTEASVPGPAPAAAEPTAVPVGEGEGGVDATRALTDAVAYRIGLAVAEAHARAALAAFAAGNAGAAAEMFAHPVSEVLFDFEPAFQALGVAPFDQVFLDASTAALAPGASLAQVEARTTSVLVALEAAAAKSPADTRSLQVVAVLVIADMIDRASRQYGNALQTGTYERYLDGYGFRAVAEAQIFGLSGGFRASQPRVISALEAAAAQLERAFPTATLPTAEALAPAQDLAVANARLQLAVSGLR